MPRPRAPPRRRSGFGAREANARKDAVERAANAADAERDAGVAEEADGDWSLGLAEWDPPLDCDAGAAEVEPVAMSRAQVERQLLFGDQKEQFNALCKLQAAAENSAAEEMRDAAAQAARERREAASQAALERREACDAAAQAAFERRETMSSKSMSTMSSAAAAAPVVAEDAERQPPPCQQDADASFPPGLEARQTDIDLRPFEEQSPQPVAHDIAQVQRALASGKLLCLGIVEAYEREKEDLKKRVQDVLAEKEALARNCEIYEKLHDKGVEIQKEMAMKSEGMQQTLLSQQKEIDGLAHNCELHESIQKEMAMKSEAMQKTLQAKQKEVDELTAQLATARHHGQLAAARAKTEEWQRANLLQVELEIAEERVDNANAKREESEQRAAVLQEEVRSYKKEAAENKDYCERLEKEVSAWETYVTGLIPQDEIIAQLKAQLAAARAKTKESEQRAAAYKEEADENKEYYERLENAMEKDATLLIEQKDIIADLTAQLAAARAKTDAVYWERVPLLKDGMTDMTAAAPVDAAAVDSEREANSVDGSLQDDSEDASAPQQKLHDVLEMNAEKRQQLSRIHFADDEPAITQYSVILAKNDEIEFSYNVSAGWRHEWRSYPNNAPEAIQLTEERNDGAPKIFKMRAINTGYASIKLYQHEGSPAMPIDGEVERWIGVVVVESSTEKDEATTSRTCAERLEKHRILAEKYAERTPVVKVGPTQTHANDKILLYIKETHYSQHIYTTNSLSFWSRETLENVCHAEAARGNALLDKVNLLKHELEISQQRVDNAKALARDSLASLAELKRVKEDAERVKKEAEHDIEVARKEKRMTKGKLKEANKAKKKLEIELQEAGAIIRRTNECLNNEHDLKVRAEEQARTAEATLREARQKYHKVEELKNIQVAAVKKERNDRLDVQKRLDVMTAAVVRRVTIKDGTGCVFCLVELATHLMVQCGHTILCKKCADEFVKDKKTTCYVCNTPFDKNTVRPVVQVYNSAAESQEQEDPDAWFRDSLIR